MSEDRIKRREALNQVIAEGEIISTFVKSEAWDVLKRTLQAQADNYKTDCYDAAKDMSKNLANYLGRQEAIEWVIRTVESAFVESMNSALEQRKRDEEIYAEEDRVNQGVNEIVGTQTYQGERQGFI